MFISNRIKADTVFSLLQTGLLFDAKPKVTAKLVDGRTSDKESRDVELELYSCVIDARTGLNEETEQYFLDVLKAYKEIPQFF